MALGSVDEFKSRLAGGGARGNLFQVTLANPRGGLGVALDVDFASFMCEAAQDLHQLQKIWAWPTQQHRKRPRSIT